MCVCVCSSKSTVRLSQVLIHVQLPWAVLVPCAPSHSFIYTLIRSLVHSLDIHHFLCLTVSTFSERGVHTLVLTIESLVYLFSHREFQELLTDLHTAQAIIHFVARNFCNTIIVMECRCWWSWFSLLYFHDIITPTATSLVYVSWYVSIIDSIGI